MEDNNQNEEKIKKTQNSLNEITEEFKVAVQKSMEPAYSTMNKMQKTMEPLYTSISEIQKTLQPMISIINGLKNSLDLSSFYENIDKLIKGTDGLVNAIERYKLIIIRLGFPPSFELDTDDIYRIVNTYDKYAKEKTERLVNRIYKEYYNYELIKGMSNGWYNKDILRDRKKILRQAVYAHLQGNYYLSIPIVFSQLEGIIAETFNHEGQMNGRSYVNYLERLLCDNDTYSLDGAINQFYKEIILVSFGHNQQLQSILSRHAIMHGGDINYGTKINSIKALVLFDYILEKISEYSGSVNKRGELTNK